jgi:hypothetical protein
MSYVTVTVYIYNTIIFIVTAVFCFYLCKNKLTVKNTLPLSMAASPVTVVTPRGHRKQMT